MLDQNKIMFHHFPMNEESYFTRVSTSIGDVRAEYNRLEEEFTFSDDDVEITISRDDLSELLHETQELISTGEFGTEDDDSGYDVDDEDDEEDTE